MFKHSSLLQAEKILRSKLRFGWTGSSLPRSWQQTVYFCLFVSLCWNNNSSREHELNWTNWLEYLNSRLLIILQSFLFHGVICWISKVVLLSKLLSEIAIYVKWCLQNELDSKSILRSEHRESLRQFEFKILEHAQSVLNWQLQVLCTPYMVLSVAYTIWQEPLTICLEVSKCPAISMSKKHSCCDI